VRSRSRRPRIDWARLDRTEKLVVSERLVRSTKTLADFDVVKRKRRRGSDGRGSDGRGLSQRAYSFPPTSAARSSSFGVTAT